MDHASFRLDRRTLLTLVPLLAAGAVPANAAAAITFDDAWTRPSSGTATVLGTIVNGGPQADRLLGGMTPNATSVELHDAAHGATPVAAIPILANGSVALSATGPSIQLVGLKRDVAAGDAILLRLHFEQAGYIVAIVRAKAT
jgi:copper(I)-binding protein